MNGERRRPLETTCYPCIEGILHRMMGLWRGNWRNIEGSRHQAEAKKVIDAGMLHYRDDELVC